MPDHAIQPIAPASVRYIKLGQGGCWEAALDDGRLEAGYEEVDHGIAEAGDWKAAAARYIASGTSPGVATRYANELKAFYTAGPDVLWITFARGFLWWAFAEPEVHYRGRITKAVGARYRRTIGPWRNTDRAGTPLALHALSTRLTQVGGYRGTICSVAEADYLIGRINLAPRPLVTQAQAARAGLATSVEALIGQLHWAEFELFVDLVFTRSGWRRVSVLGGTMKDIDLLLEQPLTGERIAVQVKSRAGQGVLDECVGAFIASGLADRFYFVCHSPDGTLTVPAGQEGRAILWSMTELARAAVDVGLVSWVLAKAA